MSSVEENQKWKEMVADFLRWAKYDRGLASSTVAKYKDTISWIYRDLPDIISPEQVTREDITGLREKTEKRGVGPSRVNSIIFTLRSFFEFCREVKVLDTISPKDIKPMRVPYREQSRITADEFNLLVGSAQGKGIRELRFRALAEGYFSSGMRNSELLSLDRTHINWDTKQAVIIGKGGKQRHVYFSPRALKAIKEYLDKRADDCTALFVTFGKNPKRMKGSDQYRSFRYYAKRAGIDKKITPHTLRRSMATNALRNGSDIRFIKEVLGHSEIETTAKYYAVPDKEDVKRAHEKFFVY